MNKRTSSVTLVLAILAVLALMLPAAAAPKEGSTEDHGKSGQVQASDHDGDADSDPATAAEDGHEAEPDATLSDNQHPSGKDRSAENGNSGNQGKAESHPDDSKGPERYEGELGADKPGGAGGTDLEDQDGNNGCGNDDDFNDDNNGYCGGNKAEETGGVDEDEGDVPEILPEQRDANEVLSNTYRNGRSGSPAQAVSPTSMSGGTLPFTGANVVPISLMGLLMVGLGFLLVRRSGAAHE